MTSAVAERAEAGPVGIRSEFRRPRAVAPDPRTVEVDPAAAGLDPELVVAILEHGVGAREPVEDDRFDHLVGHDLPVAALAAIPGVRDAAEARLDALLHALQRSEEAARAVAAWQTQLLAEAYRWGRLGAGLAHRDPDATRHSSEELEHRTAVAELATLLAVPEGTMSVRAREAVELTADRPAVLDAVSDGRLSLRHAQALLDGTRRLPEPAWAAADAELVPLGVGVTVRRFAVLVRRWCDRRHPVPTAERHATAREERCVRLVPERDGMTSLWALLPTAGAEAVYDGLTRTARAVLDGLPASADHGSLPGTTLDRLRADVLVDRLLGVTTGLPPLPGPPPTGSAPSTAARPTSPDPGDRSGDATRDPRSSPRDPAPSRGGARVFLDVGASADEEGPAAQAPPASPPAPPPTIAGGRYRENPDAGLHATIHVTVPIGTLLGEDLPGELAGVGPIDPALTRQLVAGARTLTRVLVDPVDGAVRAVDRTTYRMTGALRRLLQARDGTCRFMGCPRPVHRCDVDHAHDWAAGGCSDPENLVHLCRHHHRLKHLAGWRVAVAADGVASWVSPRGRRYRTEPALRFGAAGGGASGARAPSPSPSKSVDPGRAPTEPIAMGPPPF
ncbi:HNH endonuclease signature motif containing protein [Cellulomonas endophytica]|uniref:HNH endonuclease signature motif containing protein n=1 Tax=Cellulomonas endophytica TaxID=2494735 RepID=UPI0013E92534|nr:HNH endonuclease signature motif containing protein [Cellulomonas endophytica]